MLCQLIYGLTCAVLDQFFAPFRLKSSWTACPAALVVLVEHASMTYNDIMARCVRKVRRFDLDILRSRRSDWRAPPECFVQLAATYSRMHYTAFHWL